MRDISKYHFATCDEYKKPEYMPTMGALNDARMIAGSVYKALHMADYIMLQATSESDEKGLKTELYALAGEIVIRQADRAAQILGLLFNDEQCESGLDGDEIYYTY